MGVAHTAIIFAMGFFALVAQTLLFRDFITAFEGNELGIGCFFASWLIWVCLGACAGRVISRNASDTDLKHFEFLPLLYLPAFVLQRVLILNIREIVGVQAYELFPLTRMIYLSFLTNAFVSFLTGCLFTLACKWATARFFRKSELTVAGVYIFEALGACTGGILVTVLLSMNMSAETVFLWASLVLTLVIVKSPKSISLRAIPTILIIILILAGAGNKWAAINNLNKWQRILPGEYYTASFSTAQTQYLYGQNEGQFVVMSSGSVCETLPGTEHASEVVALHMPQKPDAKRILVVGSDSLAICLKLAELPQTEEISWLHPDPEYPKHLLAVLPDNINASVKKLNMPGSDVRSYVQNRKSQYDMVILNVPETSTLVMNRYSTQEFLTALKEIVVPDGIVSLRIPGPANFMSEELAYIGASALTTLNSVFANTMLKPGDETWLLASNGDALSDSPALLRDRWGAVKGSNNVFPPTGLLSLYIPNRIAFQMQSYHEIQSNNRKDMLLNTDDHPKALLFALLYALRRADLPGLIKHLSALMKTGTMICAIAILIVAATRITYLIRGQRKVANPRTFDGRFMVLSMGIVGMSLSLVLMFLYQSRFGALFLHMGIISSLFMFGTFIGGLITKRILSKRRVEPSSLIWTLVCTHIALIGVIYFLPDHTSKLFFTFLFFSCGLFTGTYFPIAVSREEIAGHAEAATGGRLETLDHCGGAIGSIVTALVLLPILGVNAVLFILALMVLINLSPQFVANKGRLHTEGYTEAINASGYIAFALATIILLASNLIAWASDENREILFKGMAVTMAGTSELQNTRVDNGGDAIFLALNEKGEKSGYVYNTAGFSEQIFGYGGQISLAVYVKPDGSLIDFRLFESNETPAYLDMIKDWMRGLSGRNIFSEDAFKGVDAVSGATLTSRAIMWSLEQSGPTFASQVLGMKTGSAESRIKKSKAAEYSSLLILVFMATAIALRTRPNRWIRRIFMFAVLLLSGIFLNYQYSSQHVFSLLALRLPNPALSSAFLLVLIIPAAILLFGNIYCGYMCPFGIIQEFAGDLRPRTIPTNPGKPIQRYTRGMKYALLFFVTIMFALTRDVSVLITDPLITMFSTARSHIVILTVLVVAVLSFYFRRFWCRSICPVGAFLSLLSGTNLLTWFRPKVNPDKCDLGVENTRELDCIQCDRCRHETK